MDLVPTKVENRKWWAKPIFLSQSFEACSFVDGQRSILIRWWDWNRRLQSRSFQFHGILQFGSLQLWNENETRFSRTLSSWVKRRYIHFLSFCWRRNMNQKYKIGVDCFRKFKFVGFYDDSGLWCLFRSYWFSGSYVSVEYL